jgi:steroid 5-alpha reductase family enzyme/lysophospholipase L1-like esterase
MSEAEKKKKFIGVCFLGIIYIVAFFLGILMFLFTAGYMNDLWRLLISSMTSMVVIYIVGVVFNTSSFIDPYWSLQTPVYMLFLMIYYNAFNVGTILFFSVFTFWAIRLTFNFLRNYTGPHYEDWRYRNAKKRFKGFYFIISFFAFHLLTTLSVFASSLPMYYYITIIDGLDFGLWQLIGLIIMTLAVYVETQADSEMYHFRKNRSSASLAYDKKLWKHVRHPNYLAEFILWAGASYVYISAPPYDWFFIFCSMPVIFLIIVATFIAEKHYLSYKPDYKIYKKNTFMYLPIAKKKIPYLNDNNKAWVTFYGQAQSKGRPDAMRYAKDLTLRYPIFVPFGGSHIRITLDNYCVDEDIHIDHLVIARGKSLSDLQEDPIYVTFQGERRVHIYPHMEITSDPIPYKMESDEYLIVNIYIKGCCKLTGCVDIIGPLSKGYFAYGDQSLKESLDKNTSKSFSWVHFISNIDIYTDKTNECVVCYGDSITSQDWPDYMDLHLREMGIKNIAVVRKAVSGTRILREYECITYQSYCLMGKKRFYHEVSSVSGCKKVIIQHGINDIIHPVGEDINPFRPMSDMPTSEDLITGLERYQKIAERLKLETYYGKLLPIYNWRTYAKFREDVKNEVNDWIRKQPNFIDFENEIGKKADGIWYFKDEMDSSDHLHPSKKAYQAMGNLAAEILYSNNK